MSKIELFELCGAERDRVFSPYCWIVRYALAHKGLDYTTTPITFSEKEKIAFSGQKLVPVLKDGEQTISDSWDILHYLDKAYPDAPALFPNGDALARFVKHWAEGTLYGLLAPIVIMDIYNHIAPEDKAYFRQTREARFGMTLEEFAAKAETTKAQLGGALEPLRRRVKESAFLEGDAPTAADFIVLGPFLWARGVCEVKLLSDDDPVRAWRQRLFDAYQGLGLSTLGYAA